MIIVWQVKRLKTLSDEVNCKRQKPDAFITQQCCDNGQKIDSSNKQRHRSRKELVASRILVAEEYLLKDFMTNISIRSFDPKNRIFSHSILSR